MSALCKHGADKEQNIHSDRFQETAGEGGAGEQAPSLPSKPACRWASRKGPRLAPLSSGKGPTMSPGAGGGEVRTGREGERGQPGLEPSVVTTALGEAKTGHAFSRTFCIPFREPHNLC